MGQSDYFVVPKKQNKVDELKEILSTGFAKDAFGATGGVICITEAKQNLSVNGVDVKAGDKMVCIWSDKSYIGQNVSQANRLIKGVFENTDALHQYRANYQELFNDIDFKGDYASAPKKENANIEIKPAENRAEQNEAKTISAAPEGNSLAHAERLKARLLVSEAFTKTLNIDMDYFDAKYTDTVSDAVFNEKAQIKEELKKTGFDITAVRADFDELLNYSKYCANRVSETILEAYGWDSLNVREAINKHVQTENPELRCACLFSKAFLNQADGILANQTRNTNVASAGASAGNAASAVVSE